MSETSKLFSSVLMIGAGFGVASLMGPPQIAEGIADWVRPKPASDPYGLRPLPSGAAASVDATGWPTLPAAAPAPPADARPLSPEPSRPAVAAADGSVRPASWPSDSVWANDSATDRPASAAGESSPAGDWLTSSSLWARPGVNEATTQPTLAAKPALESHANPLLGVECESCRAAAPALPAAPPSLTQQTGAATRRLTPVRRTPGPQAAPPATAVASALPEANAPGWPSLTPPANEVAHSEPLASSPSPSPIGWAPAGEGAKPRPLERSPRPPADASMVGHIVADGDTLESIARRYLGDAARAGELFELNRDRLEDPQLLPIGMVLQAPRRAAGSPWAGDATAAPRAPAWRPAVTAAQPAAFPAPASAAPQPRQSLRPIGQPRDETVTPIRSAPNPIWDRDANWDATGW